MVKIKGIFRRTVDEFKYFTSKNWTYKDAGDFWDTVHDYDEIDDETYAYKRRFYDSIKMCSIPKDSKILDIDCRTGNGTVFYHRNGRIKEAVCISPSPIFLDVCKKRLKKYNIKSQTMLLRERDLNLKDQRFDAILCFETIEHVSSKFHLEFLKELNRVLKQNGEMILTMPNILWEPVHWFVAIFGIHHSEGPHRFLRRSKIKNLLKKAGFKLIKEDTTVLIPVGPRWLTKFGEHLENSLKNTLMPYLGLRRIFICKKVN